jgi:hypothetical protein
VVPEGEKPASKRLRLYIDESGDHAFNRWGNVTVENRYLCLVGVMFPLDGPIHDGLEALKRRHFPRHHPEEPYCFHRRELIDAKYPFHALRDPAARERFDRDMLAFLASHQYIVIGVVLDKKAHDERWHKQSAHPYNFCLHLLLERYVGRLLHRGHRGDVMVEARGGREDKILRAEYSKLYAGGTQFQPASQFQRALTSKELKIKTKTSNVAGLQIADLIARDVMLEILSHRNVPCPKPTAFGRRLREILVEKYNRRLGDGRIDGYGRVFV